MNVGLVGCGRVAQLHMCAYKHISEANVVAVSDMNYARASNFAKKYGIRDAFGDYAKILEMQDLDYVDICTPTATHANIACEAAGYGHNILLEKPMARDSKDCDRIIHEVSRHRVKLCICHNQLFIPDVVRVKRMVDSDGFDLIYLRTSAKENPELIGPSVKWITTPEQGGILWESGLHLAYLQLHFLKDITEVLALGSKIRYSVYDHFSVLLRTGKQAIGAIELTWSARNPEIVFEFMGSDGRRVQIVDYNYIVNHSEMPKSFLHGLIRDEKTSVKRWVGPIVDNLRRRKTLKYLHHYGLISSYIQSLREDSEPPVTPADGRSAIRLLECIEESLEKKQPVRVEL